MDHSKHALLADAELLPDVIAGATIYDAQDNVVGSVSRMQNDEVSGDVVVVDVGDFLGTGSRPVSFPMSQLDFMRDENGEVHAVTTKTRDEVGAMPEDRDS